MNAVKKYIPHLLVLVGFIVVALLYFSPVLQNKVIYQSDIVQYTGMAKEQNNFRAEFNEEPYWTNSAFGGMPTYQLGAKYPYNFVKQLDSAIRFLPRPADYLFLYFLGFYALMLALGVRPLKAFIGSLAFGFSTYLIIILGVGHNAKAHAIAYMPMVVAGVLLVFRKKYVVGGILTVVAAALEISANHFQMTYYLLLFLVVLALAYTYQYGKAKDWKGLGVAYAILVGSALLSIGANATNIMATAEYTKFSTRSSSELTYEPDGSPKVSSNAMSYDYITEYSYGIFESLNLIAPRLTGGANNEVLEKDNAVYHFFTSIGADPQRAQEMSKQAPTYWGSQPIVAAPAYIGAVVFFLFVLGMFTEKRKIKYIFFAGALLALLLSWGKNFAFVTNLFIDFVPMYNKFRAVSSIQVILEMCMPVLAILGLYSFFKLDQKQQVEALKKTSLVAGGIIVFLFAIKGTLSFTGLNDDYYRMAYGEIGPGFIRALIEERKAMYTSDLIRSFLLMLAAAVVLFLIAKDKLKEMYALVIIGCLLVGDLVMVDRKYVNDESFVSARKMTEPFEITQADKQILNDPTHFRVFDAQGGLNSAKASYFHQSLGGYHAAKPRRIQQLADYQMSQNPMPVFNMMNVKYVIQPDEEGRNVAMLNQEANGNAWFVSAVQKVTTADEEMKALNTINTKTTAVLNTHAFTQAVQDTYTVDSLASIQLVSYKANQLIYESENPNEGLAVFSEVYYPQGWIAKVDGQEVPILAVDYVLRALTLPKGKHTIEFTFEPQVVKTGSRIALASSLLILLLAVGAIGWSVKKRKEA